MSKFQAIEVIKKDS